MRFSGRTAELAQLKNSWDRVTQAEAPAPQLVLIKGGMGVGKTRLAMEFFRMLQASNDKASLQSYWPALPESQSGKIQINPDIKNCRFDQRIPFLWWGVSATDPGKSGTTLFDGIASSDGYLHPQLVALSIKARAVNTGKALAQVWGNVLKGGVASALQIDAILSVGEGMLKSLIILRDRHGGENTHALARTKKRIESRADALLEDLEAILNPASPGFAKTPAVFVFDDAQFAWADPSLLYFYEKLMHKAMTQRWPALILATHWKTTIPLPDGFEQYNFAQAVQHALGTGGRESSPVTQLRGGYLHKQDFCEIDLPIVPDLSGALLDRYPGLLKHQTQALLDHAGGNPRHLEQIIEYLSVKESYFEDFDKTLPLTEPGLKKTLATTQNIFDLILRRLSEEPVEVQEALCIASLQGLQFLSEIVHEIAVAHLKVDRSSALSQAADPLNLIIDRNEFSEFSERLYLSVAETRRTEIKSLADETRLITLLQDSVRARAVKIDVQNTENRTQALLTLRMAVTVLSDADPIVALDALASISVLERRGLNEHNAFAAAQRFHDTLLDSRTVVDASQLNLRVLAEMCAMLEAEDSIAIWGRVLLDCEAKAMSEPCLASMENFAFVLERSAVEFSHGPLFNSESFKRRIDRAISLREAVLQETHTFEAEVAFCRSRWLRATLVSDYFDSLEAREVLDNYRDLARRTKTVKAIRVLRDALIDFGELQVLMPLSSDMAHLLEAEKISRELFLSERSSMAQRELAHVLDVLGHVASVDGEGADSVGALSKPSWEEALAYVNEAAAHYRELVQTDDDPVDLQRFTCALFNSAKAHRALDQSEAEIVILKELIDVCDKRVDHAITFRHIGDKFVAVHLLGNALKRIGILEAAETHFYNARALFHHVMELEAFQYEDQGYKIDDIPRRQLRILISLAELAVIREDEVEAINLIEEADKLLDTYPYVDTFEGDLTNEIENLKRRAQNQMRKQND